MHDPIAAAIESAAEHGAPPKTWNVDPEAHVRLGTGTHPFDGMVITHWTRD